MIKPFFELLARIKLPKYQYNQLCSLFQVEQLREVHTALTDEEAEKALALCNGRLSFRHIKAELGALNGINKEAFHANVLRNEVAWQNLRL